MPISDDPDDFEPLTQNHMILDEVVNPKTNKTDPYTQRWRHVQYIPDQFWRRWIKGYLPSLQMRSKWLASKANIKVGDLAMVVG